MSQRIIACISEKGGVGKTTTAINLSACLASRGKKVLLVDTDLQGHIAECFGVEPGDNTIAEILVGQADPTEAIVELRPNLSGILADFRVEEAARILIGENYRETKLKRKFKDVSGYDFIIFDCPPGLGIVNQNVLMYADEAIATVKTDYLSLTGLKKLEDVLQEAEEMTGHKVNISHVVPTFYDARTSLSKDVVDILIERYNSRVAKPIRINIRIPEAQGFQKTIFEYDSNCAGAEDYNSLADKLMSA
jgi:chromosome partitioning protein